MEIDRRNVSVDPRWATRIPQSLAMRKAVLPVGRVGDVVTVACAAEPDAMTRASVERAVAPCAVRFVAVDEADLRREIVRVYGTGARSAAAKGAGADDPVLLVEEIFRAARLRRASDIHVNPVRDGIDVRFRADGEIEPYKMFGADAALPIVNRIKVLAGLDIAERRAAQDGGFTLRDDRAGPVTDVRVATLPTRYGERVTLRLLATTGAELTLETLGMNDAQLKAVTDVLASPHGLLLLTGPTGSGKSTTLYAAIKRLLENRPLNVLTVEDPIEYEIDGAVQCEVDAADKINFSKALRSLLRHDPDVVMIGEVRDVETLDVAVKAALTGHLVLSTLHTNDAIGAVTRLRDMGLENHLAAATLRMSIAQRLVRRLCRDCGGAGCLACAGRGYFGRIALFELFRPDGELARLIAEGANEATLRAAAVAAGFESLADDAARKVAEGITTDAEVAKVL